MSISSGPTSRGGRTRAAVIAAARRRFAEEGFEGAAGSRIAADAGVSEPTIAFHFGSKAGLLVAVMEDYYDELLHQLEDVVDPTLNPSARLAAFARWWLAHNAEHWGLLAEFGRHGRRRESSEVTIAFRDCNRRVTRAFDRLVDDLKHVGVVRQEASTRMVRDVFFGGCEHLIVGHVTTGRPADLDAAVTDLLALLLHGAAPPSAAHLATPSDLHDKLDQVLARLDRLEARATTGQELDGPASR